MLMLCIHLYLASSATVAVTTAPHYHHYRQHRRDLYKTTLQAEDIRGAMKSRSTFTVFHFFVFVLVAAAGAAAAAARPFFSTMAASVSLAFRYPPSTLLPRSSC